MAQYSVLKQSTQPTMLLGQSYLNPKGVNIKKKAATLMITSLVDAFSILVIYLLFGPSITGESIKPDLGVQLPVAYQADLTDHDTSLVIKNNRYFLQDHEVSVAQLVLELKKLSTQFSSDKNKALVIIADQKNDIEKLNPVLIAASEAGLSQLRLAVEHQGD